MKKTLLKLRANFFRWLHKPRMLNNIYKNPDGNLARNTRISSTVEFVNSNNINLGHDVYIGHNVILDGTSQLKIEEGCQISAKVSILTHSSHISIRLFGKYYNQCNGNVNDGYIIGKVIIGKYTFIGTNTTISPSITIGKGCIIGANSFVNIDVPDYTIAYGSPATIRGDTRTVDKKYLKNNKQFQEYYNKWNNE